MLAAVLSATGGLVNQPNFDGGAVFVAINQLDGDVVLAVAVDITLDGSAALDSRLPAGVVVIEPGFDAASLEA